MKYYTHISFSLLTTFVLIEIAKFFSINLLFLIMGKLYYPLILQFYFFLLFGSVLVDIDLEESFIGKKLWFVSKPLRNLGIKHKGFFHSLMAFSVFAFALKYIVMLSFLNEFAWYGFIIGYGSHLLIDFINQKRQRLLFPLKSKIGIRLVAKNSKVERFIFFTMTLLFFLILLYEKGIFDVWINMLL